MRRLLGKHRVARIHDAGGPPLRWPRGSAAPILHRAIRRWRVDHRRKLHPLPSYSRQKRFMATPFIAEVAAAAAAPHGGQSSADRRTWRQGSPRWWCLLHTVQLLFRLATVKWTFAIGAVRRRDSRRVGGPHRRGGAEGGEQLRRRVGRLPDNLLIAALKPTSRSRRRFGRGCGGRMPCTKPRSAEGFHFIQPLQRRLFRVRETIAVICEASLPTESPA